MSAEPPRIVDGPSADDPRAIPALRRAAGLPPSTPGRCPMDRALALGLEAGRARMAAAAAAANRAPEPLPSALRALARRYELESAEALDRASRPGGGDAPVDSLLPRLALARRP